MISLTQGLLEARPRGEQRLQTMVNNYENCHPSFYNYFKTDKRVW